MVLAALVVSAVLSIIGWQRGPVREAAVANPMIVDLLPDTEVRGSSDSADSVVVAMDNDLMVLVIHPEVRQNFPEYGLEVLDHRGDVVADVVGVERTEYGNFQVAVWRSRLPEPPVRLRLSGFTPEGRETLGLYTLEFESTGLEAP